MQRVVKGMRMITEVTVRLLGRKKLGSFCGHGDVPDPTVAAVLPVLIRRPEETSERSRDGAKIVGTGKEHPGKRVQATVPCPGHRC